MRGRERLSEQTGMADGMLPAIACGLLFDIRTKVGPKHRSCHCSARYACVLIVTNWLIEPRSTPTPVKSLSKDLISGDAFVSFIKRVRHTLKIYQEIQSEQSKVILTSLSNYIDSIEQST